MKRIGAGFPRLDDADSVDPSTQSQDPSPGVARKSVSPKGEPKPKDLSWEEACTLDQWVIQMIESKQTKEPAFQQALEFWGREKFEKIWKDHQARKKGSS